MKKNRIVFKLFAVTAGILLAFLAFQFLFQYFYMEKFYVYSKKKAITNEIFTLKQRIEDSKVEESEIDSLLMLFSEGNNAFAGISNIYGIPQYGFNGEMDTSNIEMKDSQDNIYKIYIDDFYEDEKFMEKLKTDKRIEVKGTTLGNKKNEAYPDSITIDGEIFSIPQIELKISEADEIYNAEITVESSDLNTVDIVIDQDSEKSKWTIIEAETIDKFAMEGTISAVNLPQEDNYRK